MQTEYDEHCTHEKYDLQQRVHHCTAKLFDYSDIIAKNSITESEIHEATSIGMYNVDEEGYNANETLHDVILIEIFSSEKATVQDLDVNNLNF